MIPLSRCLLMFTAFSVLICGCAESPQAKFQEYHSNLAEVHPSVPPTFYNPLSSRVAAKVTSEPAQARSLAASTDTQPKLMPGDVIDLKVYQEDELTSHVRVNPDGTVNLPLLGTVQVGGMTVEEASEYIRAALARDYLRDPHVTLTVSELAKKRFSVMGEVKMPGFYQIPEGEKINVIEALSMAGGYTAFSRGTRIQIKRIIGGKEVVLWVDAKAMARKKNVEPLEVLPGDAITVNSNLF